MSEGRTPPRYPTHHCGPSADDPWVMIGDGSEAFTATALRTWLADGGDEEGLCRLMPPGAATTDACHRLIDASVFEVLRVELLDGKVVPMPPMSPARASTLTRLPAFPT